MEKQSCGNCQKIASAHILAWMYIPWPLNWGTVINWPGRYSIRSMYKSTLHLVEFLLELHHQVKGQQRREWFLELGIRP